MRQVNLKKYVLPNLPYLFVGLYATKLGQAWRLSSGMEFADKVLHLMAVSYTHLTLPTKA